MKVQRNTLPKKIILDTVKNMSTHPTVDEVFTEVQKTHPTISKNTVYRNLRQLANNGEIRKISLPGEQERYDRLTVQHYHFQCKNCGSIYDVELEYLESINETAMQKYGFQIDEHEIVFRGTCPKCGETHK